MPSTKKIKKNIKKKKISLKNEQRKKIARLIKGKYYAKYPSIEFINEFGDFVDENFVKIIKEITKGIKFNNRKLFTKWQEKFFILLKKNGSENVLDYEKLVDKASKDILPTSIADHEILHAVGEIIFRELEKKGVREKYIPFQGLIFDPIGKECKLRFAPLCREKSKFGTIYYSHLFPKINIDGCDKIVGFSKHAIERISKRTLYENKTYAGYGELRKLLVQNIHYELVNISGKNLITFYDYGFDWPNDDTGFSNVVVDIAKYILGDHYIDTECYYYRVGYMPIGLSGDFASGITLLLPGMKGTPEYELLNKSSCYRGKKDLISQSLKNIPGIVEQSHSTSNLDFLKYFHDNGIKQIITLEKEPYIFDSSTP